MGVKKIKISALPLADTLVGLYTIGVNALNKSVKVSLEFLKTAADKANDAATAADNAANLAGETAEEARATIVRLEELEESLVGQYKMIPTGMNLDYPPRITFRNTVPRRITYELLPTNTGRNVLFLGDDNAVSVQPDGSLTVNRTGISKIHVIPTENTSIYRTIQITVAEPELRRVKSNSLRLMGNGSFRLT